MAEAEEVLTDVARHATVFARDLWRRRRNPDANAVPVLAEFSPRLELLVRSLFAREYPIRPAHPPPPPTLLTRLFSRGQSVRPARPALALPATDGCRLWLPAELEVADRGLAPGFYRVMALQQATRAQRGSIDQQPVGTGSPVEDIYWLLECLAADEQLGRMLPGMQAELLQFRRHVLARRPPPAELPPATAAIERLLRDAFDGDCRAIVGCGWEPASPESSVRTAERLAARLPGKPAGRTGDRGGRLNRDWWTGETRKAADAESRAGPEQDGTGGAERPSTARLERRPRIRRRRDDEDEDRKTGAWMVQADEPHQKAEDPMGMKRPTDRGDEDPQELGEMLSELPEARLVSTPGSPREVLVSDDPPESRNLQVLPGRRAHETSFRYPEWDYRRAGYRLPGALVRPGSPPPGNPAWLARTMDTHRRMLEEIRRRFEMLRTRRTTLRRQRDGDDIDLDACVDAMADLRAGCTLPEGLYRATRPADRQMAITLLIDVSGSTDSWVSAGRRVIDVEREALLLVCFALQEFGEPFAVQAFSGAGADDVTVRTVKEFSRPFDETAALHVSGLEPERYTRAGAAIRHASAGLMQESTDHRLLLLLSDGKPNDVDHYAGEYGVEDTHRAIVEARLQGIFPFCLTVDRQAATYLPRIFGPHHYAMLPRPELLPGALLDWMRRLLTMQQS